MKMLVCCVLVKSKRNLKHSVYNNTNFFNLAANDSSNLDPSMQVVLFAMLIGEKVNINSCSKLVCKIKFECLNDFFPISK